MRHGFAKYFIAMYANRINNQMFKEADPKKLGLIYQSAGPNQEAMETICHWHALRLLYNTRVFSTVVSSRAVAKLCFDTRELLHNFYIYSTLRAKDK